MQKTISEIAKERVANYAPYPQYEPSYAGMVSLMCVGMICTIFAGLAGMSPEASAIPTIIMAIGAYGGPFWYYRRQKDIHFTELVKVEKELREQESVTQSRRTS